MKLHLRRAAYARWRGTVPEGEGAIRLGSGAFNGPYSLKARVEESTSTNPEELIGAGHAGCFTMSLADLLSGEGHPPEKLVTKATVNLEQLDADRWALTRIDLEVTAEVPGVDEETFRRLAQQAKDTCPISRALAGTEITLSILELSPAPAESAS